MSSKKDYTVEIVIAIIGVLGTIGAAIVGNWDKIIAPKITPISTATPTSNSSQSGAIIFFKFTADDSFQPSSGNHVTSQLIQPDGGFHAVFRTVKLNRNETWLWGYQYNRDGSLQAKFGMIDSNDIFINPWVSISKKIYYSQDSAKNITVSGINNKYDYLEATAEFVSVK